MRRHRTTARGVLLLSATIGLAAGSAVAFAATKVPEHIIFPVVGKVQYIDDFGAPRGGGSHQGNDLMAAKKSPAVAAEAGKVKYWTTSGAAGCMLYLYGESGTTYLYIHLNNDLTMRNDNRGKCVNGTAYTVKNGAKVAAGQQIAYVGDSGDANGGSSHLHFEVHPGGGRAVSPYPYLQKAYRLLFTAKPGTPFSLTLTGTVVSATIDRLVVNVSTSQAWPSGLTLTKLNRTIALTVPEATVVQSLSGTGALRTVTSVTLAEKGQKVVVWTQPASATLKAQRADDGVLSSALIQLG
ncbi:MAG: M23 family metallopeptidase [Actinomycetota bacterium]|nr:M23 family metallopeptidase [Actinomycetota bacterium]